MPLPDEARMESTGWIIGLPYPAGTVAGPARLDFYRIGPGECDTVGSVDFVADPAACVEVMISTHETCPEG